MLAHLGGLPMILTQKISVNIGISLLHALILGPDGVIQNLVLVCTLDSQRAFINFKTPREPNGPTIKALSLSRVILLGGEPRQTNVLYYGED